LGRKPKGGGEISGQSDQWVGYAELTDMPSLFPKGFNPLAPFNIPKPTKTYLLKISPTPSLPKRGIPASSPYPSPPLGRGRERGLSQSSFSELLNDFWMNKER